VGEIVIGCNDGKPVGLTEVGIVEGANVGDREEGYEVSSSCGLEGTVLITSVLEL
jgi:hypothetical protein